MLVCGVRALQGPNVLWGSSPVCGVRGAQLVGVGQRIHPAECTELGAARLVMVRARARARGRGRVG
eukprot:scaffold95031_cov30-Phaeocystis_antarctica.AAC.1